MPEPATALVAPVLTPLQTAWLEELGLDSQMLARQAAPSVPSQALSSASPGAEPSVLSRAPSCASPVAAPSEPSHAPSPALPAAAPSAPLGGAMHGLQLQIASCTACGLHAERHLAVPGSGAAEAVQLMVIGEAPGAEDDRLGQPFRGMAGELLQAMLKAAGMTPESRVFYTQLVKCRPVANRPLAAEEVAACLGYLRRQIALTQPRQLLLLGRVAAQTLLGELPVEALRGRVHSYEQDGMTIPAVVTFHPAALLSRPRHKASAWQDLSLLGRL